MIQELRGKFEVPWQISKIIEDVHVWLAQNIQYAIKHMYREANMTSN